MVIDFNRPNNAGAPVNGRSGAASAGERAERSPSKSLGVGAPDASTVGESVQLSAEAQQLQQANDAMRAAPAVDEARVERIKAAIADGSYQVDPERIAAKLLALETAH